MQLHAALQTLTCLQQKIFLAKILDKIIFQLLLLLFFFFYNFFNSKKKKKKKNTELTI
jgi:hypothetical protein